VTEITRSALAKEWVHSHEEDGNGIEVYRSPDHPFPPARGRDALHLQSGGTLVKRIPGPDDRPTMMPAGKWKLEGKKLILEQTSGSKEYAIESLEPDKLLLRPL
jgi:hypothetical protein